MIQCLSPASPSECVSVDLCIVLVYSKISRVSFGEFMSAVRWSNVIEATATWDELAQRLCEASSEYSHVERGILKRVGGKRAFIEVESARKRSKTSLHVNVPLEQYAAVTCHGKGEGRAFNVLICTFYRVRGGAQMYRGA